MAVGGEAPDWATSPPLAAVVLVLLTVFVGVLLASLLLRKRSGRTVLILGAPDAGKTTLFFQLLDRSTHRGTVASMQANEADAGEEADLSEARLVDVPGHPRVRGEWEAHLPATRGVVFLVDGVNFLPIKTVVAEQLFDVLAHPQVAKKKLPVLLAINKADAGIRAHRAEFVRKRLEKELEALRSSRADLAAATGGSGSASLASPAGEPFTFAGLQATRGITVEVTSVSAIKADGVDDVRAFVRGCVSLA